MEKVKVIWSDKAVSDLKEIHTYISKDFVKRANLIVERILDKTRQLEIFPESGRIIPELNELLNYRELIVKPYRVQYRIEKPVIYILQVIHSKRFFEGVI